MSSAVDPEQFDSPEEAEAAVREMVGRMLDGNQTVMLLLRERAFEFEQIAVHFDNMADWARDIADICSIKSRILADRTGDIIAAELGLEQVEPKEDDDE